MRKISIAPRLRDFANEVAATVDYWFTQVTERFGIYSRSGAATTSDIPTDQWGLWKDTATSKLRLVANDSGTMKSVDLFTNPSIPVFQAVSTVNQSIPNAAFTKVVLNSEVFDSDNYYDAPNSKFQPLVAGYYAIKAELAIDFSAAVGAAFFIPAVYKNGVEYSRGLLQYTGTAGVYTQYVDTVVQMNGTTDFIELFVFQNTGAARNILFGSTTTFVTGYLVRPT